MAAALRRSPWRASGQALVEYVVGLLFVYWILFDANFWGDRSALEVLIESFQKSYQGYEYAQSQPAMD